MTDDSLPSSFDLWFDLKSREQLVRHYAQLRQEIEQIEDLMESHGMEFTSDEMAIISPDADDDSVPLPTV